MEEEEFEVETWGKGMTGEEYTEVDEEELDNGWDSPSGREWKRRVSLGV